MTQDDPTRTPAAAGKGASGTAAPATPRPRPRRELNLFDRVVRVPIGFLWLGVLVIVAVLVFTYMTLLYWAVRGASALFRRNRPTRVERPEKEKRVA